MQKLSLRKMSVLGLVLMGASALTAAIVPAKKERSGDGQNNGRLALNSATAGGANVLSCVPDAVIESCTATEGSINFTTTGRNLADSFVGTPLTDQTVGNTSDTSALAGDQSSVVN